MSRMDVIRYSKVLAEAGFAGELSLRLPWSQLHALTREAKAMRRWVPDLIPKEPITALIVATYVGDVVCTEMRDAAMDEYAQQLAWGAP